MLKAETRSGSIIPGGQMAAGYAAVYNQWANIGGEFLERLSPGVFTRSLREEPDVLALWCHDYDLVLGRTTSGTLRLFDDVKGLRFELDLDERTPDGARAIGTIDRGDVAGLSFSMIPTKETWEDTGALPRRTITEAWIFEVSCTPIPAYEATSVALVERAQSNAVNARRRIIGSKDRAEAAMRLRGIPIN